ncbi:hypothetical protein [Deinococcus sp. S9]|uniref:hypothetical protein n=1 Tax=Deinococcus sp. S9 TaxID=2545754 RepID=UPI0014055E71|nr:hypothetical protein [Deinococcus sp. S9]
MTTPEQLRVRLQQHVESLASALATGQTEPLLAHLRAQAHPRGYSAQNRTLVHLQALGATHVPAGARLDGTGASPEAGRAAPRPAPLPPRPAAQ